jgi:GNAT superfamily N-acetyltransferase
LTPRDKAALAELAEAAMTSDFFRAASPDLASKHSLRLEQTPSYTACLVGSKELAAYNTIMAFGVAEQGSEQQLEHLVRLYEETSLPVTLRLSIIAQPPDIGMWLKARDFVTGGNSVKMYRDLAEMPAVDHGFNIEQVGMEKAGDFTGIACLGLSKTIHDWLGNTIGRAGWHHYLARLEDKPVAAAAFFISGDVAQFGWTATLPEYRRRGVQTALLVHRIREATRLGCKLISADTNESTEEKPNSSYHNMLRVGFVMAYLRPKYVRAPGR